MGEQVSQSAAESGRIEAAGVANGEQQLPRELRVVTVLAEGEIGMSPEPHASGAELRDVIDLDLEEGFVELLRASRPHHRNGG